MKHNWRKLQPVLSTLPLLLLTNWPLLFIPDCPLGNGFFFFAAISLPNKEPDGLLNNKDNRLKRWAAKDIIDFVIWHQKYEDLDNR